MKGDPQKKQKFKKGRWGERCSSMSSTEGGDEYEFRSDGQVTERRD